MSVSRISRLVKTFSLSYSHIRVVILRSEGLKKIIEHGSGLTINLLIFFATKNNYKKMRIKELVILNKLTRQIALYEINHYELVRCALAYQKHNHIKF